VVLLLILILVKGVEKLEGWKEDGNCAPVGRKGGASVQTREGKRIGERKGAREKWSERGRERERERQREMEGEEEK